ncbi:MAG: choice-of-anchor I family protein [Saccharospirillum sp.]
MSRLRTVPFSLLTIGLSAAMLAGCGTLNQDHSVQTPTGLSLSFVGRYSSGLFDESAAEITAYDATSQRAFVVNAQAGALDVLDMSNPGAPTRITSLSVDHLSPGAVVNSVATHGGRVAIAVETDPKTDNGFVALYTAETLSLLGYVSVGAQPDMVTFTPDGRYILSANEGEPSDDYQTDPEGSISIIAVSDTGNLSVATADFTAFNPQRDALTASGVRIFGPGATVAQDLEPEYITISADSQTAWVALQENNALARVDISAAEITDILPLGFKNHGLAENGLDVSDDDGRINIRTWAGVYGIYHPDAISSFEQNNATYIVTANEGDARAWGEDNDRYWGPEDPSHIAFGGDSSHGFVEEIRFKHLFHHDGFARRLGDDMPPQLAALAEGALLNPSVFAYCGAQAGDPGECREDDQLGRLTVTWTQGYRVDAMGNPVMFNDRGLEDPQGRHLMYDRVYAYSARSMAIWSEDGALIWDSGDAIEQYLASDACMLGSARDIPCADFFNANHDDGESFESRSDNKGPEPEAVTVAQFGERTYAFLGLERMGGIMVFDVTTPAEPSLVEYFNTREDWLSDPETNLATVGDLGIEDITVVPADQSPSGEVLLITGNEVSGTTAVYQVTLQYED